MAGQIVGKATKRDWMIRPRLILVLDLPRTKMETISQWEHIILQSLQVELWENDGKMMEKLFVIIFCYDQADNGSRYLVKIISIIYFVD